MIKNADKLMKKFVALSDSVADAEFKKIVDRSNKGIVQAYAKMMCPVNHGGLREHIFTSIEQTNEGVTATTATNIESAAYVEFGTGPIGQANHEGISPEVTPAYSQHGWGIPADKVDPADAEQYKWPKREYGGKEFYMTSGQPAQPFMYPALKNNEKRVKDEIAKKLAKKITKEAKK